MHRLFENGKTKVYVLIKQIFTKKSGTCLKRLPYCCCILMKTLRYPTDLYLSLVVPSLLTAETSSKLAGMLCRLLIHIPALCNEGKIATIDNEVINADTEI